MIKAVIFDIDGTITDTNPLFLRSLSQTFREFTGVDKPDSFFIFTLGIPSPETLKTLKIPSEVGRAFVARWQDLIRAGIKEVQLFPGVRETIENLYQEGIKMALVTSKIRSEMSYQFDQFMINRFFETIICAEDASRSKPYPDPLLLALDRLGVKNNESIFVGDSIYDIQAAKGASIPFALASWGALELEKVLKLRPDFILREPEDIEDIVKGKRNTIKLSFLLEGL
ncbi:MAG: hypothetical protein PWP57_600 [Candidatus Atribacteria bacterium]|nr:hypothetical protein [Candidatus Atribacteria bacterium]